MNFNKISREPLQRKISMAVVDFSTCSLSIRSLEVNSETEKNHFLNHKKSVNISDEQNLSGQDFFDQNILDKKLIENYQNKKIEEKMSGTQKQTQNYQISLKNNFTTENNNNKVTIFSEKKSILKKEKAQESSKKLVQFSEFYSILGENKTNKNKSKTKNKGKLRVNFA